MLVVFYWHDCSRTRVLLDIQHRYAEKDGWVPTETRLHVTSELFPNASHVVCPTEVRHGFVTSPNECNIMAEVTWQHLQAFL